MNNGVRDFSVPETVIYQNRFLVQDTDQTVTSPRYYGYVNETGEYYIMKATTISTGLDSFRYYRPSIQKRGNYPVDWNRRTTLKYGYWDQSY